MDVMALSRPAVECEQHIRMTARPASVAAARSQVRALIDAWDVPVDPSVAVLLTSELVTNALRHETGGTITLTITCVCGQLRIDVHDSSRRVPMPVNTPVDAEAGRGLLLVSRLATDWGFHPTPSGKAVYFTLAFEDDPGADGSPRVHHAWAR
jgi:anti-sigma regulatory factor (Ser/Thr protein kinase)